MEDKLIDEAYNRELARFQPIMDAVDASSDGKIVINGYICDKERGLYGIKPIEGDSNCEIIICPNMKKKTPNGLENIKFVEYLGSIPLGMIEVSSENLNSSYCTIGLNEVGSDMIKNTILENAIKIPYKNPTTDKKRERVIQQHLTMLKSLGVELTPEENMAFLRGRKAELEEELAQINEQLNQKDSQQK